MPYIPEIIIPPVLCAFILGIAISIYSYFVVVKRWAFLSVGVSHAAFGGVALGLLMGISPQVSSAIFAIAAAIIISFIKRQESLNEDASIGVIFSTFMAIGVILFSMAQEYTYNVFTYLFGNMLAVGWKDFIWAALVATVSIAFFVVFKKELILISIDEEFAYTCGVPSTALYYSLVILFTFTVVVSIKLLGVILVSSLTVIPASVGLFFSRRLNTILAISVVSCMFIMAVGLMLSFFFNLPPGATTAAVGGMLFFGFLPFKK